MPASSSGPKRTRQPVREARRHNPLRGAKKKAEADFDSEGWDRTLLRFRAHLDTLCNFQNGQPSGGFVPETALAKMNKFIKEDLKRSVSDFFTAFSFIISQICQPGNSRFETRGQERESAPGMWKHTLRVCCRKSARQTLLPFLPKVTRMKVVLLSTLSRIVSIGSLHVT